MTTGEDARAAPMARRNGIVDIDHIMCKVNETEDARRMFERLGFMTTPRSSIKAGGVANRLVIFAPKGEGVANFVELMAVEDHRTLEPAMAEVLAGRPGIKSLVNVVEDAALARACHIASGFTMLDVWPKERTWRLPSGEELVLAFRVVLPEPHQVPLMFNSVEYLTLHHYLRPEFRQHPNTARRWTRVSAVVGADQLDEAVETYERLYGSVAGRQDGEATVQVRDTCLRLLTPEAASRAFARIDLSAFAPPCYCAITIEVTDVEQAAAILAANDVHHVRHLGSLLVDPAECCGTVLELVQEGYPETDASV